ncbi:MAG: ATP-binding protein [Oscillospiraceae bacterium]|nr:ATP-binding protein [Oscillospiraceae bacterium]
MSYNKRMFEEAEKIISQRRKNAIEQSKARKREIYKLFPKILKIDNLISKTSIDVAKEVLSSSGDNLKEIIQGLMLKNISLQEEKKLILKKNNYPEDYLEISYYCNKCEDSGYTKDGICDCKKQLLKEQAYKKLNMSVNINNFKFSNFKLDCYPDNYIASEKSGKTPREIAADNFKYCEDYAYNFFNKSSKSKNILMQGGTGLGKTHLSLAIAGYCIENGVGVVYASSQQLLHKLESDKFGDSQEGFLDSVLECDLLIIDDLGAEFYTQFTISAFYNIINTRLLENKSTIINTNLSLEEILLKYSQRLASRIIGEYNILTFYGKDYRLS